MLTLNMGKGGYTGGHTIIGPKSGWFSKEKKPKKNNQYFSDKIRQLVHNLISMRLQHSKELPNIHPDIVEILKNENKDKYWFLKFLENKYENLYSIPDKLKLKIKIPDNLIKIKFYLKDNVYYPAFEEAKKVYEIYIKKELKTEFERLKVKLEDNNKLNNFNLLLGDFAKNYAKKTDDYNLFVYYLRKTTFNLYDNLDTAEKIQSVSIKNLEIKKNQDNLKSKRIKQYEKRKKENKIKMNKIIVEKKNIKK